MRTTGGETRDAAAPGDGRPSGSADGAGEPIEGDLDELVQIAAQRDEYLALAQRTQADFENYRKRVARESAAAQERGVAALAKELLPRARQPRPRAGRRPTTTIPCSTACAWCAPS